MLTSLSSALSSFTAGLNVGSASLGNENIVLAATLTDDDLVSGSDLEVTWPSSENRFNHCTVRFSNESENFKEDSVGWPPKISGTFERGIDGRYYTQQSGWDDTAAGQNNNRFKFLNKYAVWSGTSSETNADGTRSFSWKIFPKITGSYTFQLEADDTATIVITKDFGNLNILNVSNVASHVQNISLDANTIYTIQISCTDNGGLQGVGALLKSPDNFEFWTTRNVAYTDIFVTNLSNSVYLTLLSEDNNVELETDIFLEGVTDYYHALAKAEEVVRTSRSAFGISFKYIIKNKFLEPGDFIRIDSIRLQLQNLYLRINEVKILDGGACEVQANRFDWTQLAWNVKDDEFIRPNSIYNFDIDAPYDLVFTATDRTIDGSVGKLSWKGPSNIDIFGYIVYYSEFIPESPTVFNFKEIGRTNTTEFVVPALTLPQVIFGVRSVTTLNKKSKIVQTALIQISRNLQRALSISANHLIFIQDAYSEVFKTDNIVLTANDSGFATPTYQWYLDDVSLGATGNQRQLTILPYVGAKRVYKVIVTDTKDNFNLNAQVTVQGTKEAARSVIDPTPPPAPLSLVVTEYYSVLDVAWTIPTYVVGGGHYGNIIYGKIWPANTTQPTFSDTYEIGRVFAGTRSFIFPGEPATRYIFWVKEISKDGIVSTTFAGPASGTTSIDVTKVLETLTNQIKETHLFSTLNDRINLIDDPVTGLVKITDDLETVFGTTQTAAQYASNAANSAVSAATAELAAAGYSLSSSNNAANAFNYANSASNSSTSAAGSASNASNSAALAASSANSASNSASNALIYSNNSANSASNAAGSASTAASEALLATNAKNAAANSEANALVYKNDSANSASNAASSASSASSSATLATNAKNDAANSASNALIYSNNSANSASNAASSASNAASQALLATNAKNAAANSEANALVYKNDSANSASSAAGSASSASSSATTATNSKNDAANSAAAALISKNDAANSATSAAGSASSASSSATTATSSKNDAANSAAAALVSKNDAANSATNAAGSATSAAQSLTNVTAIANNQNSAVYAAIQQRMIARASSTGAALAEYSVVVDANGKLAGFGLGTDVDDATGASTSTFGVRADKFYVYNSTSAGSLIPFIVEGNTVYITTAAIKDATITLAKINTATITNLSSLSVNAGTVTAGVLRSSDNKFIIDLNNKYISIVS